MTFFNSMNLFRVSLFCGAAIASNTVAAPISIDAGGSPWEVYHFREVRGPSSIFSSPSNGIDTLSFGVLDVVPNGKGEDDGTSVSSDVTTVVARQNGVEVDVGFIPDSVDPNNFGTGVAYDANLTGSWQFEITNGPDTLFVNSPEVGTTEPPARVTSVKQIPATDPTTPTFSWQNNDTSDEIKVTIYDLLNRNESGRADRVWIETVAPGGNSFTVPTGTLDPDGLYSIRISTRILRTDGINPSGSSQAGAALVRGDTFFDFATSTLPPGQEIYLPELSYGPDDAPIFNFDNPVLANMIEYYDPIVAVGYDYMIGENNPFFSSFILPEVGDNLFDLFLHDGSDWVFESQVSALDEYSFDVLGVDRFRILGIETSAGLDPNDATAFVTGLSFVDDGRFTGTMTPISVDVPAVPLPGSLPLIAISMGTYFVVGRRKRKMSH